MGHTLSLTVQLYTINGRQMHVNSGDVITEHSNEIVSMLLLIRMFMSFEDGVPRFLKCQVNLLVC